MNQDFWNFNHSFGDNSFSLLMKLRLGIEFRLVDLSENALSYYFIDNQVCEINRHRHFLSRPGKNAHTTRR